MGQITKPPKNTDIVDASQEHIQAGPQPNADNEHNSGFSFRMGAYSIQKNWIASNAAVVERLRDIQNDFDRGAYHRAYETLRSTIKDLEP